MNKLFSRKTILLAIWTIEILLIGCAPKPATVDPAVIQTAIAGTANAMPTYTPYPTNTPYPTSTPVPTQPPEPIVYYYFVAIGEESPPAGSVVILPDELILGPTQSDIAPRPGTAANIGSALQAMLNDPRNAWLSTGVNVTSVSFNEGTVNVVLEGEYFGAGDIVLIAARAQIFLTVFADASVQTATITINGKNIANMGVSNIAGAKPDDYTYTRAEVETFIAENAYQGAEPESQEITQTFSLLGIWQQNRSMAAGWADRYHFYPSGTFHFYPNEMICSQEKIEKIGTWKFENSILTLTSTKKKIKNYDVDASGLCHAIGKKEVELTEPGIEQLTVVDRGTQEGDIYPSISIDDQQFWKFSDDASRYGDEEFPE